MEEPSFRPKDALLLDLSDEQKVPINRALLAGAEYDDTFGLYNKGSGSSCNGQGDKAQPPDVNGNAVDTEIDIDTDSLFDMEILDVSALVQFPSFEESPEKCKVPVANGHSTDDPSMSRVKGPVMSPATLYARMLQIEEVRARIMADLLPEPRVLDFTADDIPSIVAGKSRANEIVAEILELFAFGPAPGAESAVPSDTESTASAEVSPKPNPDSAPIGFYKRADSADFGLLLRPDSAPPSPIGGALSRDTTLSLRDLNDEKPAATPGLRRTQSCASGSTQRFMPPIAASSPRPNRAELNRSSSMDGPSASGLQRSNSFKRNNASVKSSGYGMQSSSLMPPPTKCAPSPIRARSRNSVAGILSSPYREAEPAPGIRPIGRSTPTRGGASRAADQSSSKANLDSTFVSTKAANTTTLPKIMPRPGQTAGSQPPRNGKINLNVTQVKASVASGPKAPSASSTSTAKTKEDVSKMLNKFGFRK